MMSAITLSKPGKQHVKVEPLPKGPSPDKEYFDNIRREIAAAEGQ